MLNALKSMQCERRRVALKLHQIDIAQTYCRSSCSYDILAVALVQQQATIGLSLRTLPGKGKQDALALPRIALRTAWLAKQNCDAHHICDFGAVAFPERTAVLFTRSHDQPG